MVATRQRHDAETGAFWRAIRLLALWGNLLYLAGALTALALLPGLGPAPWRAHANVVAFAAVATAAGVMNVRGIRARAAPRWWPAAIALNVLCFWFLFSRPAYAFPTVKVLVLSVPVLNALVIGADSLLGRLDGGRLARQCAKLDPAFEATLAEEGLPEEPD